MLQRCQAQSIYNPTTDTEEINSSMWANGQDILGVLWNYFTVLFIESVRNGREQWLFDSTNVYVEAFTVTTAMTSM